MTAPMQYEVEKRRELEVEEMPDGRWKVKKINISIYNDPGAAVKAIQNYIKQKEEEKNHERIK